MKVYRVWSKSRQRWLLGGLWRPGKTGKIWTRLGNLKSAITVCARAYWRQDTTLDDFEVFEYELIEVRHGSVQEICGDK